MRQGAWYEQDQVKLDRLFPRSVVYVPWRDELRMPPGLDSWDLVVARMSDLPAIFNQLTRLSAKGVAPEHGTSKACPGPLKRIGEYAMYAAGPNLPPLAQCKLK